MPKQTPLNARLSALVERNVAWNLGTHNQRWEKRRQSSSESLENLYNEIMPYLQEILAECDRFPLGELPETHRALYNIALAVAEVAPHIELYPGSVKVPNSFEEGKVVASHGNAETWKG